MSYMYGGSILRVDLSKGKISREPTAPYASDFLGGRGINIKFLYDGAPAGADPLDPASLLAFGAGPLCGTQVPGGRVEVTAKSPESGLLGTSSFGGSFGPEMKYAGYDNIVITGKSDKPVYLWIYNDEVEIRDAGHLWGKDTYQTQDIIRSELGPDFKIVCIGPAGENLVHFATIQHELRHGAGRTGMGAVMGSKNLKAIAVRGTQGISLANPGKFQDIAFELQKEMRDHPVVREKQQYGVSRVQNAMHALANRAPGEKVTVSPDELYLKYRPKRTGCFGCLTQCQDLYPVEAQGGGAISCSLYYGGSYVNNTDPELVLESALSSVRDGIDIVTAMKIIGWLMELYQRGLITAKDTDGIPMERGNAQAAMSMFRKIVRREGIGNVLADGILPAAKKIGRGSEAYAYNVKGLPIYELDTADEYIPRKGEALAVAVSPRGDSMKARALLGLQDTGNVIEALHDKETSDKYMAAYRERLKRVAGSEKGIEHDEYVGKPELVIYSEDIIIIADCLSVCKNCTQHLGYPFTEEYQAALFSAGIGTETSVDKLMEFAERVKNLERAYAIREGMTREMDSLPKEFMDQPIAEGEHKGSVLKSAEFEKMKDKYYALRGWDATTGIPTRKTLEQTGLGYVARDLEKSGKLPGKVPVK
ncbi:aldehyde ferredoxin oxidoreductase family protein [Chloroflexota bacterium]